MIMIYREVCNDNFLFSHLLHVIGNMLQSMNLSCAIKMLTKDYPFHENILSLEASVLIYKVLFCIFAKLSFNAISMKNKLSSLVR